MFEPQTIVRTLRLSATPSQVWDALTNPEKTRLFMFNCSVASDWEVGHPIRWSGNYEGYESGERGVILACEPGRLLRYSSFDPNFGFPDVPENHLHITYTLHSEGEETMLVTQIENFNGNEQRTAHIAAGWDRIVLPALQALFAGKAVDGKGR
ncbi:ATPase [Pedobacter yulinensis]|uniref:ATPase n=1 Tax=Pedobacter yulinensis TaxID=2126353 RepID=A0A2T3HH99_9SPHI|nr:SRPBCC domain-containing protein [Pedobacter yulinensis]PST81810.1 ATPase [Pedobacter yulinensis]